MGRGLSSHQRIILIRAYKNHLKEEGKHMSRLGGRRADLTRSEIYIHVFGLEPNFVGNKSAKSRGLKFKNADQVNLDSIAASISRTLSRLKRRELVTTLGDDVNLTPAGLELARIFSD